MKVTIDSKDSLQELIMAKEVIEKLIQKKQDSSAQSDVISTDQTHDMFSMFGNQQPKEEPQETVKQEPSHSVQLY
jgi:hypothetical protein